MNSEFIAIKCAKCGGVMRPNQETESFVCSFCAFSTPWGAKNSINRSEIDGKFYEKEFNNWNHKPLDMIGKYVKLNHVEIESDFNEDKFKKDISYRMQSVDDKLKLWDPITTVAFSNAQLVNFECQSCGAIVKGNSLQTIFTCDYCNNRIGVREALIPGTYKKENIMGIGSENTPNIAIPFKISKDEAKTIALKLVKEYPTDFSNQDIEKRIIKNMSSDYLPYNVWDIAMKAKIRSDKGDFTVYQEIINWGKPNTSLYDFYLIDMIDPWDFTEATPFDPVFMEGLVRVASRANLINGPELVNEPLRSRFLREIKLKFGLKKAKLKFWSYHFKKHEGSFILLPIYYVDHDIDHDKKTQVRIAINAQTGKVAASFISDNEDYYRVLKNSTKYEEDISSLSTIRTEIMPVKYIKPPFLHEFVSFEKAINKKAFFKF